MTHRRLFFCAALMVLAALASVGHAQRAACPAIAGTWSDEVGPLTFTEEADTVRLVGDLLGLPGPLVMTRSADACVYVGHFHNTREQRVEPDDRTSRVTYDGTATLTVRDASTITIEAVGESRCAWLPHDAPTRFRLTRTVSR